MPAEKAPLNEIITQHFAPAPIEALVVTRRDFAHWMRPDLQRTLESLFAEVQSVRFFGARLRDSDLEFRFADLVEEGPKAIVAGPAVYQDADIGEHEPVRCLVRGLWLAQSEGIRFAVLLDVSESYRGSRVRLEIAAPPEAQSAHFVTRFAERVRTQVERAEVWRGKTLVLDRAHDDFEISPAGVRIAPIAPVRRGDIVLPERTLGLIERNTIGFAREMDRLARLGLSAKKGVLLYGPPGAGKTMIARWLTGALDGFTKLIVSAEHYGLLDDYFAIARALQPALIVLEDIDLIGGHRDGPFAAPASIPCSTKWTVSLLKRAFFAS